MKQSKRNYNRIVIKIGSSLFCGQSGSLDLRNLDAIVEQVAVLMRQGKEVAIVSSGAIALGMGMLGLNTRPKELPLLQAAAAIGQNALMDHYNTAFRDFGMVVKDSVVRCGQVLLTRDDFNDRKRYLNAKNTLFTLFKLRVVPIVNENDTISTEEIRFGDNDNLSALVATLINADLLIIFSDVDGLLDKNKELVRIVPQINAQIKGLACPTSRKTCVGGMLTKFEAAKVAVDSGIPCCFANGRRPELISLISQDPYSGGCWTAFVTHKDFFPQRKRWIAFGTVPKGTIVVDPGARQALSCDKSLLSVGIVAVEGDFAANEIVRIVDKQRAEFARGKVAFSSAHIDKIKGTRTDKEVIHKDNIVILS